MPSHSKDKRRTEQRLPASQNLDRMTALQIIRLMNREDAKVAPAVKRALPAIAKAADAIVTAVRGGGRLVYVGAGSSGRMAVLDAAEVPPTFGISRETIRAFIAGGAPAVTGAVEGAEDNVDSGVTALRNARVGKGDVVVGIAASGTTPYVLAAIKHARERKAITIAITSNEHMPLAQLAHIAINLDIGPEVLSGSTRLKAGTAQKMVLNMLTTAAMVRLGHAYENLMIDAVLTNDKLQDRAVRILVEASGASVSAAEHALRAAGHSMKVALVMLKRGVAAKKARRFLQRSDGNLRMALGEESSAE